MSSPEKDDVSAARERLKKRYNNRSSGSITKPDFADQDGNDDSPDSEENKKEVKNQRVWHTISTKINKKALERKILLKEQSKVKIFLKNADPTSRLVAFIFAG